MMVPVTTREWLRRTFFALTGVNLLQIRVYEKIDNNQGRNEILDRKLSKWSAGNDLGMERLTGCLPIMGSSILDWVKSRSKRSTFPGFVTRQENRSIGVIPKVVATNICGSDQHMVRGRTTAPVGMVLGHEVTADHRDRQ